MKHIYTILKISNIVLAVMAVLSLVLAFPLDGPTIRRDRIVQQKQELNITPETLMEIGNIIGEYYYGTAFMERTPYMTYFPTQYTELAIVDKYGEPYEALILLNKANGKIIGVRGD